jgi:hypothetical protein
MILRVNFSKQSFFNSLLSAFLPRRIFREINLLPKFNGLSRGIKNLGCN